MPFIARAQEDGFPITHTSRDYRAPFSWTGLYLGGNVGGNWGDYDLGGSSEEIPVPVPRAGKRILTFALPALSASSGSEFLGGGQVGYNYQIGSFVLGCEGDFESSSLEASNTVTLSLADRRIGVAQLTSERSASTDWMTSLRLRGGFAINRFLIYGTGGVALADVTVRAGDFFTPGSFFQSSSDDNLAVGWAAGLGVDCAISRSLSVGVEYRHSQFGDQSYDLSTPNAKIALHSTDAELKIDEVTLRVNVHFGDLFRH